MVIRTKGSVLLTVKLVYCLLISQLALQQSRSRGDCKNSPSLPGGFLETTKIFSSMFEGVSIRQEMTLVYRDHTASKGCNLQAGPVPVLAEK